MALPVLDGNQSATTLSSVVTGGEHIVAHSVVCLGSTAIANITNAVSGSVVSISNFPSTQTIAGTVTANLAPQAKGPIIVVDSTIPADPKYMAVVGGFDPFGGEARALQLGSNGGVIVQQLPAISGTVTVGNSVTIGSLPAISGTVTVGGFSSVSVGSGALLIGGLRGGSVVGLPLDSESGNVSVQLRQTATTTNQPISQSNPLWVTQQGSVTIGSLPAISGTVTANLFGEAVGGGPNEPTKLQCDSNGFLITSLYRSGSDAVNYDPVAGNVSVNVKNVSSVTIGSVPNGSLTTRFGTPTTANTAFATSAVTNANRKYLLIQNVTTGSNVITVGIGFTPTTTQGIQLTAGAGITFESSYIPTGAVYVLSSVTASNFTILEA